jgi:hypothetical protein
MNFSHNQWIKLVIRSVNQGSIVDRRISPAHYPLEHVWLYQSVSISVPSKSVATGPSSHMLPKRASDWRQTNGCKNTTSPPVLSPPFSPLESFQKSRNSQTMASSTSTLSYRAVQVTFPSPLLILICTSLASQLGGGRRAIDRDHPGRTSRRR